MPNNSWNVFIIRPRDAKELAERIKKLEKDFLIHLAPDYGVKIYDCEDLNLTSHYPKGAQLGVIDSEIDRADHIIIIFKESMGKGNFEHELDRVLDSKENIICFIPESKKNDSQERKNNRNNIKKKIVTRYGEEFFEVTRYGNESYFSSSKIFSTLLYQIKEKIKIFKSSQTSSINYLPEIRGVKGIEIKNVSEKKRRIPNNVSGNETETKESESKKKKLKNIEKLETEKIKKGSLSDLNETEEKFKKLTQLHELKYKYYYPLIYLSGEFYRDKRSEKMRSNIRKSFDINENQEKAFLKKMESEGLIQITGDLCITQDKEKAETFLKEMMEGGGISLEDIFNLLT